MGLALDEPKEDDDIMTVNEIPVVLRASERNYLEDSIVDFEKGAWGEGFVVRSGHASSC